MTLECDDGRATTGRRSETEEFAFLVGHELRQPLATAANLVALMEEDCEDRPHGLQRSRMRQIRTLIQRTAELLAAQTALASAWPRSATPRLVSVGHLVEDALLELKSELERAAVRVEIGPLPWLRVDPGLLQQLFRNVIENAVRYRRAGAPSQIAIHSEARDAPDPAWAIQVRDNGRGFSTDQAEAISRALLADRGRSGRRTRPGARALPAHRRAAWRHRDRRRTAGRGRHVQRRPAALRRRRARRSRSRSAAA